MREIKLGTIYGESESSPLGQYHIYFRYESCARANNGNSTTVNLNNAYIQARRVLVGNYTENYIYLDSATVTPLIYTDTEEKPNPVFDLPTGSFKGVVGDTLATKDSLSTYNFGSPVNISWVSPNNINRFEVAITAHRYGQPFGAQKLSTIITFDIGWSNPTEIPVPEVLLYPSSELVELKPNQFSFKYPGIDEFIAGENNKILGYYLYYTTNGTIPTKYNNENLNSAGLTDYITNYYTSGTPRYTKINRFCGDTQLKFRLEIVTEHTNILGPVNSRDVYYDVTADKASLINASIYLNISKLYSDKYNHVRVDVSNITTAESELPIYMSTVTLYRNDVIYKIKTKTYNLDIASISSFTENFDNIDLNAGDRLYAKVQIATKPDKNRDILLWYTEDLYSAPKSVTYKVPYDTSSSNTNKVGIRVGTSGNYTDLGTLTIYDQVDGSLKTYSSQIDSNRLTITINTN